MEKPGELGHERAVTVTVHPIVDLIGSDQLEEPIRPLLRRGSLRTWHSRAGRSRALVPVHMQRQHIFVANRSSDVLDVIWEMLQGEPDTVTTTNFLPNTIAPSPARDRSLRSTDLAGIGSDGAWGCQVGEVAARQRPVILEAASRGRLDEEGPRRWPGGSLLIKSFGLDDRLQTVDERIG